MNEAVDLLVIGGGPAGAAAGIFARLKGLNVALAERSPFPRHRPGETFHPGIEPVLRILGVLDAALATSSIRPLGIMTAWGGPAGFVPFGRDHRGDWRAIQIMRSSLDPILLARFVELGGELLQPQAAEPLLDGDEIRGARIGDRTLLASATIDASGTGAFVRRGLGVGLQLASKRLFADYGYVHGSIDHPPTLNGDRAGWLWTSEVKLGLTAWTRLSFDQNPRRSEPPAELAHFEPAERIRTANVTWRRLERFAGQRWYAAGDAAMSFDPTSSHGVLRALMSGVMAASAAIDVVTGRCSPQLSADRYSSWLDQWFQRDAAALRKAYGKIGAAEHFRFPEAEFPSGLKRRNRDVISYLYRRH